MALRLRTGAGLSFLAEEGHAFYANVGASLVCFVNARFFLEAGLDHAHLFTDDYSGYSRPFLGIGMQF